MDYGDYAKSAFDLLKALGFEDAEYDEKQFLYLTGRVVERVRNLTHNPYEIPPGLKGVVVNYIAADWLFVMKATGKLTGFDFTAAVKQITEGDTSVTFETKTSKTDDERIDDLIDHLRGNGDEVILYRKLRWGRDAKRESAEAAVEGSADGEGTDEDEE